MVTTGEHVVAVRRPAAAGDVDAPADRLAEAFAHPMEIAGSSGREMLAPVDELTPDQRGRLVARWADRYRALDEDGGRDGDPWYALLPLSRDKEITDPTILSQL